VDFPHNWRQSVEEIAHRLRSGSEQLVISGLTALKNIMEAFEFEVDGPERAPLNELVAFFFPMLEQQAQAVVQSQSPHQIALMHLLAKIFAAATHVPYSQLTSSRSR